MVVDGCVWSRDEGRVRMDGDGDVVVGGCVGCACVCACDFARCL